MTFWHIFTNFNGQEFSLSAASTFFFFGAPSDARKMSWGLSPFCRRVAGESCPDGGIDILFISLFRSLTIRSIGSNSPTFRLIRFIGHENICIKFAYFFAIQICSRPSTVHFGLAATLNVTVYANQDNELLMNSFK